MFLWRLMVFPCSWATWGLFQNPGAFISPSRRSISLRFPSRSKIPPKLFEALLTRFDAIAEFFVHGGDSLRADGLIEWNYRRGFRFQQGHEEMDEMLSKTAGFMYAE